MSEDSYDPNQDQQRYNLRSCKKPSKGKKSSKIRDPNDVFHKDILFFIGTKQVTLMGPPGNAIDPTVCLFSHSFTILLCV